MPSSSRLIRRFASSMSAKPPSVKMPATGWRWGLEFLESVMLAHMSPKQQLHEQVDRMSDDEAAHVLDVLGAEEAEFARLPPLTPEQIASIERGLDQARRVLGVPHEEVRRMFGLAD